MRKFLWQMTKIAVGSINVIEIISLASQGLLELTCDFGQVTGDACTRDDDKDGYCDSINSDVCKVLQGLRGIAVNSHGMGDCKMVTGNRPKVHSCRKLEQ